MQNSTSASAGTDRPPSGKVTELMAFPYSSHPEWNSDNNVNWGECGPGAAGQQVGANLGHWGAFFYTAAVSNIASGARVVVLLHLCVRFLRLNKLR